MVGARKSRLWLVRVPQTAVPRSRLPGGREFSEGPGYRQSSDPPLYPHTQLSLFGAMAPNWHLARPCRSTEDSVPSRKHSASEGGHETPFRAR